ncbi:Solute carrier family 12 member 2 [Hondaea fermentalgiana]|uniref:Solute carrier family 12 member 3 n=1 Tax=Hondaea fermentalgiana TaxID=2315210 RepID=A0A2R5GVU3_9STRA|nr:Solute carrier family 12 member 2 [Hondaea fermentalgiana]|eukprot:GBG33888.1 Solute carrier family 12 member 2 [Hondaea fermentalgiana]
MHGDEVSPSTIVYRSEGTRTSLQQLIDSVAFGGSERSNDGNSDDRGSAGSVDGLATSKVVPPPGETNTAVSSSIGPAELAAAAKEAGLASSENAANAKAPAKLTWVQGVFIPCLLNIWGVIMFLRLGWVVGQAGIILACLIVFASKVVTTITALSLCAICTNGEVKGGGVYFLISRALGPIFGGPIGVLFFLAQAVATSLYVIGFAESVSALIFDASGDYFTGSELNDIRIIGLGTTVILLLVSLVGVSWYAKCQIGLLVTLLLSMASVIIGAFFPAIPDDATNMEAGFVGFASRNTGPTFVPDPATPGKPQDFFTVFAVFFPAATGVMAGANLSGDLKDPSSAIPKGTLAAISVTFLSYILLVVVVGTANLACSDAPGENYCENMDTAASTGLIPAGGLLFNKLIMENMSIWSPLLYLGVFAATLSSALASLVGAPRILQSVASDKLFPWPWFNYFGKGRGASNEPVRAYLLTFVITCGCVLIGSLDVIAPLISNFFMVSYAFTNYACFASSMAHYPGWRPSFKYYNKWLSLFGFLLCIVVMFMMDYLTSIITVVVAALLHGYLVWLDPEVNWGAAGEARKYFSTLKKMEELQRVGRDHVKTFRPQFLVMSGDADKRPGLIKFTSLLKKGGGIMICGDVIVDSTLATVHRDSATRAPAAPITGEQQPTPQDQHLANIAEGDETSDEEEDEDDISLSLEESGNASAARARPASNSKSSTGSDAEKEPLLGDDDDKLGQHLELASRLAMRLSTVQKRRQAGEEFLTRRGTWGAPRCENAFFEAVVGDSLIDGFQNLVQCAGIGRMRPNTVVLGFKKNWRNDTSASIREYEQMIRITLASNMGLMIVRDDEDVFNVDTVAAPQEFLGLPISSCCIRSSQSQPDLEMGDSSATPDAGNASTATVAATNSTALEDCEAGNISPTALGRPVRCPRTSLQGDTIDVWWVSDDGGLTMLIPHLLKENRVLRSSQRLRVLTVTNYNVNETSKLQKTEFRMVHLLQKFRIDAHVEAVETNLASRASDETVEEFEQLSHIKMDDLSPQERAKTHQTLRLVETMRSYSSGPQTSMIFVTLPIPETGISVGLYMSWLEMLSSGLPPTIMMRGNNENVLTFIC